MLPNFQSGQPLKASDLETLVRHIRDNEITSVVGGRLSRVSGGQSIIIDSAAKNGRGSGGTCPFMVEEANKTPQDWAITIAWGLVGMPPVLPDGMVPTNDPPISINWTDGWVCMKVDFVQDDTAIQSVSFEISNNIPEADETYAYYPIAYIFTTTVNGYQIQNIKNLCSAPSPSVCDLALPPDSPTSS
jgi:hypothetical protein